MIWKFIGTIANDLLAGEYPDKMILRRYLLPARAGQVIDFRSIVPNGGRSVPVRCEYLEITYAVDASLDHSTVRCSPEMAIRLNKIYKNVRIQVDKNLEFNLVYMDRTSAAVFEIIHARNGAGRIDN